MKRALALTLTLLSFVAGVSCSRSPAPVKSDDCARDASGRVSRGVALAVDDRSDVRDRSRGRARRTIALLRLPAARARVASGRRLR